MKVVLTGGGTGGHIYPALALIRYIQKQEPSAEFLYIGTHRGLENKIVPAAGIPFETIQIQGFKRSLSLDNLKTIHLFLKSVRRAKKLLQEFKPDIVIGTGGYVSGAVVYAASRLKIPTIVHEQNSVAGITNRFLAHFADKIAICFPSVAAAFPKEKVVLTGNPRASEVAAAKRSDALAVRFDLDPAKKTVLIFGGSQGALKINEAVLAALPQLFARTYQVLYASGERYYEEIEKKIAGQKIPPHIKIVPYIDRMTEVMVNADLLVARAGATSIAEFTALGLPAILIPSPYVTNDHQTKNAQALVDAGAAVMIKNDELTAKTLMAPLDAIMLDDARREKMAAASKKEGIPDAAERLYRLVKSLVH
ncbi:MAG: undecaprenyldiphospho-muramoylpentapeptide beta-N-acetylglucosaminyltransferase [Enterococcaceae bacterium]|jgi:UDP-N-acetylglucosamine--N-acetylmuramyl-(pentapeptide) pyrophosphoryl-undecaprenol N-acetylglucosamine transferase|nr:undecaprenyldiphospho-muramoylpentapeptide beta-N-acetylglucosaminyltransferase [Enterococcaceae bacterium]MCI1919113.1 undecaprenyldiphospho-muramoylpentapeptide beta-N-acetylglucosaminyltransferase [Enterococcaceae bacterium]